MEVEAQEAEKLDYKTDISKKLRPLAYETKIELRGCIG